MAALPLFKYSPWSAVTALLHFLEITVEADSGYRRHQHPGGAAPAAAIPRNDHRNRAAQAGSLPAHEDRNRRREWIAREHVVVRSNLSRRRRRGLGPRRGASATVTGS